MSNFPPIRQVYLIAGCMILTGVALTWTGHMWGLVLCLLPAIGLLITSATGFCPLEFVLKRMPWNRAAN